jgi:putative tricarboxylic transport membrane protein
MNDRILGILIALVALAFFASATQLETAFFSDPVGPKLFPYIISIVAFIASFNMIISPEQKPSWPKLKTFMGLGIAVIVLVIYAYSLRPLGFLVPTAVCASVLSYQIKPNILYSLITGIGLSAGLFVVFKFFLGLGLFAFPRWLVF